MKKFIKKYKMSLIIGTIIGIIVGVSLALAEHKNLLSEIQVHKLFIYYGICMICLIPHLIIHEAGHMVGGLLSGYEFISFRLGSLLWMKQGDKIILKRHRVPGTGGQCLMLPGKKKLEEHPYFLYHAGGVLGNLIVIIISILVLILSENNQVVWMISISLIISGVYFILCNGIPLKLQGIYNDGYNILAMMRDPGERIACGILFQINKELAEGKRGRDLPVEWFHIVEEGDLTKHLQGSIGISKIEHLMDQGRMEEAESLCNDMASLKCDSYIYHNELKYRLLFFELMGDCNLEKINQLYDEKLKKRIQMAVSDISIKRLMYAYELLVNNDEQKAKKYLNEFEKLCTTYPYAGDVLSEKEWITRIDRLKEQRTNMKEVVHE